MFYWDVEFVVLRDLGFYGVGFIGSIYVGNCEWFSLGGIGVVYVFCIWDFRVYGGVEFVYVGDVGYCYLW